MLKNEGNLPFHQVTQYMKLVANPFLSQEQETILQNQLHLKFLPKAKIYDKIYNSCYNIIFKNPKKF